jgi:hypothetical protein
MWRELLIDWVHSILQPPPPAAAATLPPPSLLKAQIMGGNPEEKSTEEELSEDVFPMTAAAAAEAAPLPSLRLLSHELVACAIRMRRIHESVPFLPASCRQLDQRAFANAYTRLNTVRNMRSVRYKYDVS